MNAQPLLEWKSIEIDLHPGITLFKATGQINGDTITAHYSKADIGAGDLLFFPLFSQTNKKPESWLKALGEEVCILSNGGYFGLNVSYSMALNNYTLYAPNIRAVTRSHNGTNMSYYPTRSAFGIFSDLVTSCGYVYTPQTNITYIYPESAPNNTDNPPLQQPGASFPEGGIPWNVSDAIGGGPMLIRDSVPVTDYTPELFPSDITSSVAPRTAIGRTGRSEIIQLVVDGRQGHSKGVSLKTLTDILLELGCVDAMNLDGGGSSTLFAGDSLVNKPSDGSTRSIPTAVAILRSQLLSADRTTDFQASAGSLKSFPVEHFPWDTGYLFSQGVAGSFILNVTDPAAYRIEYAMPAESSGAVSDSARLVLASHGEVRDSVTIQPSACKKSSLIFLGEYQLGPDDSLLVKNLDPKHPLPVAGIRVTKTGSGLPEIRLVPETYSGTHGYHEQVSLTAEAVSINPARKLIRLRATASSTSGSKTIAERSFDPTTAITETVQYTVSQKEGEVQINFFAYDQAGDSVSTTYTILLDDSPPTVSIGKQSNLAGDVGDTLTFALQVLPAHEGRLLDRLTIRRNPGSSDELLSELTPLPAGDTLYYDYVIRREDVPGIVFRFEISDDAGYSSFRDYSHQVSSVTPASGIAFSITYLPQEELLSVDFSESITKPMDISVFDISGRAVASVTSWSDSQLQMHLPGVKQGMYLVVLTDGRQCKGEKFIIP